MFDAPTTGLLDGEIECERVIVGSSATEHKIGLLKSTSECQPIVAGPNECTQCGCRKFVNVPGSTRCGTSGCNHEYIYHRD